MTARLTPRGPRRAKVPEAPTAEHVRWHGNHAAARRCGTHRYNLEAGHVDVVHHRAGGKSIAAVVERSVPRSREAQQHVAKGRRLRRRRVRNRVGRRSVATNRRRSWFQ